MLGKKTWNRQHNSGVVGEVGLEVSGLVNRISIEKLVMSPNPLFQDGAEALSVVAGEAEDGAAGVVVEDGVVAGVAAGRDLTNSGAKPTTNWANL